ncbi:hypothetical protein ACFL0S_08260, partial [Thermodesulfobacteriota bacterium]
ISAPNGTPEVVDLSRHDRKNLYSVLSEAGHYYPSVKPDIAYKVIGIDFKAIFRDEQGFDFFK